MASNSLSSRTWVSDPCSVGPAANPWFPNLPSRKRAPAEAAEFRSQSIRGTGSGAKRHSTWEPVMETRGQSWERRDSTAWPHVTLAWPKAATPCPGSPAVAKMEPLRPGTWFFWTVSLPTRLNPPSSGCTFPCLLVVPAVRPRTSYPQPRGRMGKTKSAHY